MMKNNATAMVLASFVGDTFALGAHWIYDTNLIDEKIGRVDSLLKPRDDSFHAGKEKGDFTHYGDQALILLESIVKAKGFSLPTFASYWQNMFADYKGYLDKATKGALDNFNQGIAPEKSGFDSSDLGGAARVAPLIYCYREDLDDLIAAAKAQTAMTHRATATIEGAAFIARTVYEVLHGATPTEAIEASLEEGINDIDLDARIRGSLDSTGKDTRTAIGQFGQMCAIAAALPGAIHLVTTYEKDLESALIENVMAGGDSVARGMVAGMILGAHLGIEAIPENWLKEMRQYEHITQLLQQIA